MPEEFISLDDILGKKKEFIFLSDILRADKPFYSIKQLDKDIKESRERAWYEHVAGTVEQFGKGAIQEATLGLVKPKGEPTTTAESIGRGLGQLGGFLLTPLKIGRVAGKAAGKIGRQLLGKAPTALQKLGVYGIQSATTLGTAEAVADIQDIENMGKRFLHGAKIGTIFGGTALFHSYKSTASKALALLTRQVAGRVALAAAGEWSPDMFTQDNLAHAVFSEALTTYFLRHGITANAIITGKVPTSKIGKLIEADRHVVEANKKLVLEEKLSLGKRYISTPKGKKLPTILAWAQRMTGKEAITAEAMQQLEGTQIFFYDMKSGTARPGTPIEKPASQFKPRVNELMFRIKEGEPVLESMGKQARKMDSKELATAGAKFMRELVQLRTLPNKPLPDNYKEHLDSQILKLNLNLTKAEEFYRALGIPEKPRFGDLWRLEQKIERIAKTEYGFEMEALLEDFMAREGLETYHPSKIKDPAERSQAEKDFRYVQEYRRRKQSQARQEIREGKTGEPILLRLIKPTWWKEWWDIRKYANHIQETTGLPLWEIVRKLRIGEGARDMELGTLMEPFEKFQALETPDARAVEKYFTSRYKLYEELKMPGEIPELLERYEWLKTELTPRQREYVGMVDTLMTQMAPLVRKYRFIAWSKSIDEVLQKKREVDPRLAFEESAPIFKQQKRLQDILINGWHVHKRGGERKLDEWLETHPEASKLGIIEEGNYLPGMIVGKFIPKQHQEFGRYIDAVGRGHTQTRQEAGFPEIARSEFFEKPLNWRIHNYVRQILNLKHVEKPLTTLENLTDIFAETFDMAKTKRIFGIGGDPKAHSLMEYMRLYAHRLKGYPVKIPTLGRAIKVGTSVFFRALVVRPFLWMRNLFQRGVTMPHREIMFDPRYIGRRRQWKNVPENIKSRFFERISQLQSFTRHYLFLEETDFLKKSPLVGAFFKLAEKVGRTYPITDLWNRQSVFSKTFNRSLDYITQYKEGKINIKTRDKRLGLDKIDERTHRERIRELIDKNPEEAAYEIAEWMTDNSQWIYKRTGKSLYEMTAGGEAYTNLLTWTKGITQRIVGIAQNMNEGFITKNPTKIRHATGELMGLMLVGGVASEILNHVSVAHGKKYRDYAWDMFFWEAGGVSFDLVRNLTSSISELVTSFDATPDERKMAVANFLKYIDNVAIRQLIPFSKNALAIVESVTSRGYVSPIYNLITKKGYAEVDRTLIESFSHAVFATDPNKSGGVRKHTNITKNKVYDKMIREKNPAMKALYTAWYERLKYLSDLYLRYEPVEVYEKFQEREYDRWVNRTSDEAYWASFYEMERKQKLRERRGY